MAGEWPILTIAECASSEPYSTQIGPFGEKIRAEYYTPAGAPVLRGTNVNPDGRFHDDDFVFIDPELAEAEFGKFVCEAGDVILCHKGTLGKIGFIPKKSRFKKYIMGNSMMKVRCDRTKLEPLYLYYWLCSRDGQDYIFSRVSQVGVPQIQRPLSTLREAALPVPSLAEQKAIAAVLGALDDKIELNRRMNATLEAMARALFQSWFVDPVPDDGPLPEGWEMSIIGAEAKVVGGSTPSTKSPEFWDNGEFHWVTPKDFSSLQSKVLISSSRKVTQSGLTQITSGLLPENTVLLSSRAPVGYLALTKIKTAINQGFIAMVCHGRLSPEYVMLWADSIMDKIKQAASGTTFAEISKATFRPFPIIVPPADSLNQFTGIARAFYERIAANERQSATLAETRDTLLPRLLSGELRIEEAANAG